MSRQLDVSSFKSLGINDTWTKLLEMNFKNKLLELAAKFVRNFNPYPAAGPTKKKTLSKVFHLVTRFRHMS